MKNLNYFFSLFYCLVYFFSWPEDCILKPVECLAAPQAKVSTESQREFYCTLDKRGDILDSFLRDVWKEATYSGRDIWKQRGSFFLGLDSLTFRSQKLQSGGVRARITYPDKQQSYTYSPHNSHVSFLYRQELSIKCV